MAATRQRREGGTRRPPRCASRSSASGCSRGRRRSSRSAATPAPARSRSAAAPGCRRRPSTSTSPTRRSASSRCSTAPPRWSPRAMAAARHASAGPATRPSGCGPGRGPSWSRWAEHPEFAQTLLVEIIGAGPRAAQRRDQVLQAFADMLDAENAAAARRGLIARFASPHDAFAIVGAITELVSRQVRLGEPADVLDLAPGDRPADRRGARRAGSS